MSDNTNIFLESVYTELDYINGNLIDVNSTEINQEDYINKGVWLDICKHINTEYNFKINKIFFIDNNPIIVFANVPQSEIHDLHNIYNNIWCLARPRILYLATQTEMYVYDLSHKPFKSIDEMRKAALKKVESVQLIYTTLNKFRREQIETGLVFNDEKFKPIKNRADIALIEDLKIVRDGLFDLGLKNKKLKYAHSLIGKSIFIRYLEDRKILTKGYFDKVAKDNSEWKAIINSNNNQSNHSTYINILTDRDFTFALFEQLKKDFNGDIFPSDANEMKYIERKHLRLLQQFLTGNSNFQGKLFLEVYKFDIIPIETISNIYEEFYHYKESEKITNSKDNGTHYTPPTLVEFTLAKLLTLNVLNNSPRILDPACGSGIFLVEAFKRIVRFHTFKVKKDNLDYNQLKKILEFQIAGIELNSEASSVTAFSLYLAFLNFQVPKDILLQIEKGNRLPCLIYTKNKKKDCLYFDNIINDNSFNEHSVLEKLYKQFDIVIGNPPWGRTNNQLGRDVAINWCRKYNHPIDHNEYSQMFMWRSIDFLKNNGRCGLLISSGAFLKHTKSNNKFKFTFLNTVSVQEVTNFIHVREVFFKANSPFFFIQFQNEKPHESNNISYWTVKRTRSIENTQAIVLDNTDFKFFKYRHTDESDIWKIFYFGNKRDLALIKSLRLFPYIKDIHDYIDLDRTGRGFEDYKKEIPAKWLLNYREFPAKLFNSRYGKLHIRNSILRNVSKKVTYRGKNKELYQGIRILISRGILQKCSPKGQIIARIVSQNFCFRNSIHCIKLKETRNKEEYKILLGIIWSNLIRYYFFMTSTNWGVWHFEIHLDEILAIPFVFPEGENKRKILEIVTKLQEGNFSKTQPTLFDRPSSEDTVTSLENDLNNEIYKLYSLTQDEIDLIENRCKYDIDFYYNHSKSYAIKKLPLPQKRFDVINNLTSYFKIKSRDNDQWIEYIKTFLRASSLYLESYEALVWEIIYPTNSPMVAFILSKASKMTKVIKETVQDNNYESRWSQLLTDMDISLRQKFTSQIYIEGMLRLKNDNQIIIIKRNEQRLWTPMNAYDDAEAIFLQTINPA